KLVCTDRNRTGGHNTSAISKRSWTVDQSQLPTGERLPICYRLSLRRNLATAFVTLHVALAHC
ncbi:hypothetical protein KW505_22160, partial [Vibrio fluvialis]|nr:hypothetical protein [Vibrio fluvialis]